MALVFAQIANRAQGRSRLARLALLAQVVPDAPNVRPVIGWRQQSRRSRLQRRRQRPQCPAGKIPRTSLNLDDRDLGKPAALSEYSLGQTAVQAPGAEVARYLGALHLGY